MADTTTRRRERRQSGAHLLRTSQMPLRGTIKWFGGDRGYGWIIPEDGGPDVFLHRSVAHQYSLRDHQLPKGQPVAYELGPTPAGLRPEAIAVGLVSEGGRHD